jgi:hypothetical protein
MEASGWALIDNVPASSPAYAAAIKEVNEEGRALCRKPDFYSYFSWVPCLMRNPTPEQLADQTKVRPGDRAVMLNVKAEGDAISAKLMAAHRQYNEKHGNAFVAIIEQTQASVDRVRQDYLEGRITRGEYNKRRRDIAIDHDAEALRIVRGGV